MEKKPVFINIITVSNNIIKATKHNRVTTATISMHTLAASSWCLEPRTRDGRNGK